MIQEYLYEIIILIAILTSLVIYFLVIRFKQETQNSFDFPDKANLKQINPKRNRRGKQNKSINNDTNEKMEPFILNSSDEQNFGSIYINPSQDNSPKKEKKKKLKSKDKTNEKNRFKNLKELNTKIGLVACGGDSDFYKDILKEFSIKYYSSPKELKKLLDNENTKLAQEMLFELIGIVSVIGVENIKNILNNLKEAIEDSQIKKYITLIDEYEKYLNILLEDIKNYL